MVLPRPGILVSPDADLSSMALHSSVGDCEQTDNEMDLKKALEVDPKFIANTKTAGWV